MKTSFFKSIRIWLLFLVLFSVLPPAGIFICSALDSMDGDLEVSQNDLRRVLEGFAFEHESAVASSRQFLITLSRLPDVQNLNTLATDKILGDLLKRNPLYANIFIVDAEGMYISSAEPFTPISLKNRKYFQDVLKTMDFSAGERVVGVTLKRPAFHFAYPISDGHGRFKGIVAVAIDLSRYGDRFSMAKLPEGSQFSLTDHRGIVLYRYPDGERYIGKADDPEMLKNMSAPPKEGIFTSPGLDRSKRYYAYKRFLLGENDPAYLYMRIGIQEDKILANVKRTLTISGVLFGFALFIALFSSWLIAKSVIVKRLGRLVEAANRLGQGDLAMRTGLTYGKDELGELARSFDAMAGKLEAEEREERRSREAAERLAEEMSGIAEIGRLIGSTLEIDEVYERFAAEARKLIPFDRLNVNLTDYHESTVTIAYVSGTEILHRRAGDAFPLAGSANELFQHKRTGLIIEPEDARAVSERNVHLFSSLRAGMRSLMSVPLISRNEVIGVLHFRSKEANAYTNKDLRLAERIGAQIAEAIANAQLFAKLRKTEKSLRESEREFRLLIDNAPDAVFIQVGGCFTYLNQRAVQFFGAKSAEDLLGRPIIDRFHPDYRGAVQERLLLLNEQRKPVPKMEQKYLKLDGSVIDVEASAVPVTFENSNGSLSFAHDITDRKRMEEEIREMSFRDQMTELYNRRGFITLAEQQLREANRTQRPILLTFIDCDGLKWINDTFGHEEGDRALIDTAHVLRQTFREADIVARLGGDEFAVLSIAAADGSPEELLKRLAQNIHAFNATGARPYSLSMSWGTVVYDPHAPLSLDELMSAADELMYAQKKEKSARKM
ncbi:MAG: diguanylate cyclase [Deltaproteobacteria bacterium]|nr:diguanylate cyclase [Deltaproteobacteria bacterium]